MERVVLHSDLNNFYASVECLYDPALSDVPLAVAGSVDKRHGIVLAKNQKAKYYNIKTGDTVPEALKKCPSLKTVEPDFHKYTKFSRLARKIYERYSNMVENFGPDECYIELNCGDLQKGFKTANEINQTIKRELGLTVSIGISYNKIFAKLGSDYKKPDGITLITPQNYKSVVWPLPVSDLLYIGRSTTKFLHAKGCQTIGDLAVLSPEYLYRTFGKNGVMLWNFANGFDCMPVKEIEVKTEIKSIGNSYTAPRDIINDKDVKISILSLSEIVAKRLKNEEMLATTVQVHIRDSTLESYERQAVLTSPTNTAKDIAKTALALYKANPPSCTARSLGVRACGLISAASRQLILSPFGNTLKTESLERSVDILRDRYGKNTILRAITMVSPEISAANFYDEKIIQPFYRG